LNDIINLALSCDDYVASPLYCNYADYYYDDNDFTATDMCCACGGGSTKSRRLQGLTGVAESIYLVRVKADETVQGFHATKFWIKSGGDDLGFVVHPGHSGTAARMEGAFELGSQDIGWTLSPNVYHSLKITVRQSGTNTFTIIDGESPSLSWSYDFSLQLYGQNGDGSAWLDALGSEKPNVRMVLDQEYSFYGHGMHWFQLVQDMPCTTSCPSSYVCEQSSCMPLSCGDSASTSCERCTVAGGTKCVKCNAGFLLNGEGCDRTCAAYTCRDAGLVNNADNNHQLTLDDATCCRQATCADYTCTGKHFVRNETNGQQTTLDHATCCRLGAESRYVFEVNADDTVYGAQATTVWIVSNRKPFGFTVHPGYPGSAARIEDHTANQDIGWTLIANEYHTLSITMRESDTHTFTIIDGLAPYETSNTWSYDFFSEDAYGSGDAWVDTTGDGQRHTRMTIGQDYSVDALGMHWFRLVSEDTIVHSGAVDTATCCGAPPERATEFCNLGSRSRDIVRCEGSDGKEYPMSYCRESERPMLMEACPILPLCGDAADRDLQASPTISMSTRSLHLSIFQVCLFALLLCVPPV